MMQFWPMQSWSALPYYYGKLAIVLLQGATARKKLFFCLWRTNKKTIRNQSSSDIQYILRNNNIAFAASFINLLRLIFIN